MPPPVQQPYVPILVAGGGERTTLRYVAEYGDACSIGAVSWASGAYTADETRRKFDSLRGHCEQAGRPYDSVLRTGLLTVIIADSPAAVEAKLAEVPPRYFPFFEQMLVSGTPEEVVPRVQALVDAGFQYVNFLTIPPFDTESVQLLAERVIPAVSSALAA
jgi:alkanesulfonate monooxygenase SsuD/methylene tetrahydromethanopterin reductase-like flavin-dependent oxidoreductase (luciferase family)